MKITHTLASLFTVTLLLNSCTQTPMPPLPPGQSAFNPPVGDPYVSTRDWNKYGPGAVIRTSQQTQYMQAKLLIGDANVAELANKANWTPCSMPKGSTDEKLLLTAAANYTYSKLVTAGLDAKYISELNFSYEFGNTYLSQMSEHDLKILLSTADARNAITSDTELLKLLKHDRARIVMGVLVADSVKITAKNSKNQKVDLTAEMTPEQKASLGLDNTAATSKDLSFSQPRFFVYYHLDGQQLKDLKIIQ